MGSNANHNDHNPLDHNDSLDVIVMLPITMRAIKLLTWCTFKQCDLLASSERKLWGIIADKHLVEKQRFKEFIYMRVRKCIGQFSSYHLTCCQIFGMVANPNATVALRSKQASTLSLRGAEAVAWLGCDSVCYGDMSGSTLPISWLKPRVRGHCGRSCNKSKSTSQRY